MRAADMQMATGSIVVFGEALVDDFLTGQVVGGAPFNVARNLAAFDSAPLMITRIGDDQAGALLRAQFEHFGLAQQGLQSDPTEPTGRVLVERGENGHRFTILPDQAYDRIDSAAALAAAAACTPSTVYFGTLAQRHPTSRAALRALLRSCDAVRYLDLNVREGQVSERCVFESLHEADIVKVNEEELQDLFGWYTHTRQDTGDMGGSGVRDACAALIRIFALEAMIVTLGPRGSVYFGADGTTVVHADTVKPARMVDTVGAGDAFSAIFLLGRERGWPLELTLARANEFAGAVCAIAGAVPAETAFYAPYVARWLAD
ncbi:PfkB family carbohydrate kinase [Massilia antarctica]|uniref:PfkB family carbohydrate kinase n=1 Tax=Massilia antarctica TaxID=2765360 RepID=UPI001E391A18|nr:PfkB family carbohydrate kinase [Massilia sp. H27-R4]MCY0915363.1 PfkB family carbohydrate kinase [Massilia sp. H27-R4]